MHSENKSGNRVTDVTDEILKYINTLYQKVLQNKKLTGCLRSVMISVIYIFIILLVFVFILYLIPCIQELTFGMTTKIINNRELKQDQEYKKQISLLNREIQYLSRKYNSFATGESYIIINTTDNRFFLYRNKKLIREGYCSSGSYTLLRAQGERRWIFKTPKGKYWIQGKTLYPVWRKPDWAFVEEGLPVPPENDVSRWEYGVLGDYALSIGDGYLIHGTLYKRFLGMPVTHGCVRLNDEDLKVIYHTLNIGSKVFIF
jgi:lipoprotein-anchoring transpeptidase ErfK/SrfK